jgi:hypothetical protein
MTRDTRCFGFVVLLLLAATVAWQGPAMLSEAASNPTAAVSSLSDAPAVLADDTPSEAACSPPPQCWRDRDCDPICGKRNGVCVVVNSCYRECACKS